MASSTTIGTRYLVEICFTRFDLSYEGDLATNLLLHANTRQTGRTYSIVGLLLFRVILDSVAHGSHPFRQMVILQAWVRFGRPFPRAVLLATLLEIHWTGVPSKCAADHGK